MRLRSLLVFATFWISSVSGFGSDSLRIHAERHERPDGPDQPTRISINAFLVDILSLDDVAGTVTIDYFIVLSWEDPRLADANFTDLKSKLDLTIDDIWNPGISPVNLQSTIPREVVLNIGSGGEVTYRQRRLDTFTAPLNLRRFPFDHQVVQMKMLSTLYGADQIDIVWNSERSGHLGAFSLAGWTFQGFEVEEHELTVRTIKNLQGNLSGIDLKILLQRSSAFYWWKVIFPLAFIVFMAWTVFWIDPAEFGGQVAISTASVITLIAFQLSLAELLPRISYLTRIDMYAVGTSFLVFFALGEAILTARLSKNNRHALAKRIDFHMRWAYPTVYLIMLLLLIL